MAYQNINQYVYNKWYLKPVQEVSDLSLASDERQYNEEVVFSPNLIGEFDGDVMPVKIDLNFSGSNQGFVLNYGDYNPENVVISSNYYGKDVDLSCFKLQTICDIGLTGTDNGLVPCMSGESIQYTMGLLPESEEFDRLKFDRRFKMFQTTGYTWPPNQRFSGLTDGMDYEMVSKTSSKIGKYNELYGGFYQGFYKLFGYEYEVLPTRYPKGWTVELTLKPRFVNEYVPQPGHTTLNEFYPDNAGIFFYMGTRAENKYWHWANGKNSGDTSYERVTTPLTGLSSCMCTDLNPGYTTESNSKFDLRATGATMMVKKDLLWAPGDDLVAYHQELEYVTGTVINYSAHTGELKFQIKESVGIGTYQVWRVDKLDYLQYTESNCVPVYPKSGSSDYHQIVNCACCIPPPPPPMPEHDPLFDSMSNALAVRFSGDPRNPKICVRTLTFTGDCVTTGSCQTLGNTTVTGYSVNNYCSTRGIYDDCLGTEYTDKEHWVLIDVVFERYTWFDFCDLYYRGGLGTISNFVYTATTANRSVSLIEPPLTHDQLRAKKEEFVQLNYQWLIEEFYRVGKLKLYVNGRHFETFDRFEEIIPRGLYGHKETQVGVPFNLSWGGGTQGLHDNLIFSAMPENYCETYIQDPELFPDNILSGTTLSGLSTNILLEKYFGGTFEGGISTFHMYAKPLSVPEIQHNARILYNQYDLLNPYCLDCDIIDNCDFSYELIQEITPSLTPTQTLTPSVTSTQTATPSVTPTNTPTVGISQTQTQTPTETPTQTPTVTPTLTPSPSALPSLCLVVQVFEAPPLNLPVLGIINSKPYFEYTQETYGRVYRIYWDGTQWVILDIYENFICSTMNYSGLYPDTNFAPWVQFAPPEPPYDTCIFVGTTTYPAPCSTPPNTPTPSVTSDCCETYEITLFSDDFSPCVDGNTINYLDCNNVWQTTLLPPNTTTTLCIKYGSFNLVTITPSDCESSTIRLGNCDCNL